MCSEIFDIQGFMSYMEDHFPSAFGGIGGSFLRNTVANIIDYGLQHKTVSKGQLVYFLAALLPEVSLAEIAMHTCEEFLTQDMQEVIRKWVEKNG